MPYISASIIFQLLGSVWAPLEKLQKEGESGRKKSTNTRDTPPWCCACFKAGSTWVLVKQGWIKPGFDTFAWQMTAILTMTAGTTFLMWLGEQIDEYGIGNGISLLIMAGILARMPNAGMKLIKPMLESGFELGSTGSQVGVEKLLVLAILFVSIVAGVVFITQGQRRIPTQSAKHVRGRRVYGGSRQYLPLRVNQAGVMPIIFASSLLLFPTVLFSAF